MFHAAISLRQVFYPLSVFMLILASVALIVSSRNNSDFARGLRMGITDVMVPVLGAIAKPVDALGDFATWAGELASARSENALLKSENAELLRWQQVAAALEAENKSLRSLLNAVPMGKSAYVTSRIVGAAGGPYTRSALISAGQSDGVRADQPVISEEGLVGRVVDAGQHSARVLLLTDIASRIPVVTEHSRERSIMAGNNSETPSLLYLPENTHVKVGERVLTSSDGGAFPAGIPVGVVESVQGAEVQIRPLVDWFRLEYVSVVDYSF